MRLKLTAAIAAAIVAIAMPAMAKTRHHAAQVDQTKVKRCMDEVPWEGILPDPNSQAQRRKFCENWFAYVRPKLEEIAKGARKPKPTHHQASKAAKAEPEQPKPAPPAEPKDTSPLVSPENPAPSAPPEAQKTPPMEDLSQYTLQFKQKP